MNRRDFIKLGGLATLPLFAPRLAFAGPGAPADRDVLVVLFLRGGADGLNIVVPYGDSRYYDLRPSIALPAPGSAGGVLDLDGFFGLHPALAPLMPAWDTGEFAVVHATGLVDDTRSHFDAQDFMEFGVAGQGAVPDGWLNRHLVELGLGQASPFEAVGVGNRVPLSLRGSVPALGLASVDGFDLAAPGGEYDALRSALEVLHGGDGPIDHVGLGAFEVSDVLQDAVSALSGTDVTYPAGTLGEQLGTIAQLMRAGVGLEVAAVDFGGWDHHDREAPQLETLLTELGAALAAFREDLGPDFQRVTVLTMTEFGRRAAENASEGTDHGHGSFMFALGGGVHGGQVYGEWPGLRTSELYRGDLAISTDYRTVLVEALAQRRGGGDPALVFPDMTFDRSLGIFAPR